MAIMANAPSIPDHIADAFTLGVQVGAAAAHHADLLDCCFRASSRIEVHSDSGDLEGVTYSCEMHVDETATAVAATGAVPHAGPCGEFEPVHRCGDTVGYVGAVLL